MPPREIANRTNTKYTGEIHHFSLNSFPDLRCKAKPTVLKLDCAYVVVYADIQKIEKILIIIRHVSLSNSSGYKDKISWM